MLLSRAMMGMDWVGVIGWPAGQPLQCTATTPTILSAGRVQYVAAVQGIGDQRKPLKQRVQGTVVGFSDAPESDWASQALHFPASDNACTDHPRYAPLVVRSALQPWSPGGRWNRPVRYITPFLVEWSRQVLT
jgi:hypothetical protein